MSLRGALSDFGQYILHKPVVPTLIEFSSITEREDYSRRILQRLGRSVEGYVVLNIHRIGIEAPVQLVFEELLTWDGDSTCWPNHLARVERTDGSLEQMNVYLFGRKKPLIGLKKGFLGRSIIPLFRMDALEIRSRPHPADFDNARYLLYLCSGGYPIGIFAIYVRSPIATRGEVGDAQLFLIASFNFYGSEEVGESHIVNRIWERIHNRVTANMLNKLKVLCERKFQKITEQP